ncbi:hypothetical protein GPECTOR_53g113 [Gonium pectorale]|uniref:Uncharacterized protein n=1 Tax=Gonium pectorale TaxID=33097 RepID=A0A150G6Q2_GONPE|nr:hypothetical protein GPECTOR_53g113 [Gonium pectorale]|eukprot:KXZ45527.1 hypothetical protein GPECTOR_53g113 [Gonium pectorale]
MWVYQAVTNVGIQVLLLMALGWAFSRFKLLDQAKFLPQSNFIVLMLALPAFNLYLMGIKLDLQNPEPWKSLAAFLLWVGSTQAAVLIYTWRCCGGDAGEAAVINMVLLMDNYGITGLLALNATLGTKWGTLSLLMAMGFFLTIFPFSLTAFEWEKWAVEKHLELTAANAAIDIEAATAVAAEAEAAEVGDGADGGDGGGGGGAVAMADGRPPPTAAAVEAQKAAALAAEAEAEMLFGSSLDSPSPRSPGHRPNAICNDENGLELSMYSMMQRGDVALTPASPRGAALTGPSEADAAAAAVVAHGLATGAVHGPDGAAVASPAGAGPGPGGSGGGNGNGNGSSFPHQNRYCWWSNEEYRPRVPLLGPGQLASCAEEAAAAPPPPPAAAECWDPLSFPPPPTQQLLKQQQLLRQQQQQQLHEPSLAAQLEQQGRAAALPSFSTFAARSTSEPPSPKEADVPTPTSTPAAAAASGPPSPTRIYAASATAADGHGYGGGMASAPSAPAPALASFESAASAGPAAAAAAVAAAAQGRLHARSVPVQGLPAQQQQYHEYRAEEAGQQQQRLRRGTAPAYALAGGVTAAGHSRSEAVDMALLELASGLSFDRQASAAVRAGARSAARRRRGRRSKSEAGSSPLLDFAAPDSAFRRLTTAAAAGLDAAAAVDASAASAAAASDKRLVREATAEALRRHGGLGGALRAFAGEHPQLWHILSTLSKNPMIWTMFLAMAVSVSGLRVFLDPASPRYRPEVGWVAGMLGWVNGLVVPMSIFANGAWMHGKRWLPKGEGVKMLVLLTIKLGLLPLFMTGCALLVRLDSQHVASLTLLTLCPAAATSFVLAVQYGRGVELVSLTNILGNLLLTPLIIMWLKVGTTDQEGGWGGILTALGIAYRLHDDA